MRQAQSGDCEEGTGIVWRPHSGTRVIGEPILPGHKKTSASGTGSGCRRFSIQASPTPVPARLLQRHGMEGHFQIVPAFGRGAEITEKCVGTAVQVRRSAVTGFASAVVANRRHVGRTNGHARLAIAETRDGCTMPQARPDRANDELRSLRLGEVERQQQIFENRGQG